jgi:hypothetical protein
MQVLAAHHRRVVRAYSLEGAAFRSVWGRTVTGRPLIVVVRPSGGFNAKIIGAREMDAKEKEVFEAWENSR